MFIKNLGDFGVYGIEAENVDRLENYDLYRLENEYKELFENLDLDAEDSMEQLRKLDYLAGKIEGIEYVLNMLLHDEK